MTETTPIITTGSLAVRLIRQDLDHENLVDLTPAASAEAADDQQVESRTFEVFPAKAPKAGVKIVKKKSNLRTPELIELDIGQNNCSPRSREQMGSPEIARDTKSYEVLNAEYRGDRVGCALYENGIAPARASNV
jgi:hypothetical protein